MIETECGMTPVEQIQVGDLVLILDHDIGSWIAACAVARKPRRPCVPASLRPGIRSVAHRSALHPVR